MTQLPRIVRFSREICGDLGQSSSREWLCTNGLGGYASGTVSGMLTRRYHGLLVAALKAPLGRTLVVAKLDETAEYLGARFDLFANRWADGAVSPMGQVNIESFHLEGTTPIWTFALADALLEKRVFMEQDASTTWVRYRLVRASALLRLDLKALVNYRDHHSVTRATNEGWRMRVEPVPSGLVVQAFEGATPVRILSVRASTIITHDWYKDFRLDVETARGLPDIEDHLHAGTFTAELREGETLTMACSTESDVVVDAEAAWARRAAHEEELLQRWRESTRGAPGPGHLLQLVLAADQFIVRRPLPDDPDGMSVIAGYPWFGDWGRDTMIALPGLTLSTGKADIGRKILTTFARFVDRGMLPNLFPDGCQAPEYNTADATLWYVEAIRAHVAATGDLDLLRVLMPVLMDILRWHEKGTRHGIGVDPSDGLLRAGEPGVQLTWMDAKVGDWVVTPRIGKCVELNALWYNALRAMSGFERALGSSEGSWDAQAERVKESFARFWNEEAGCLFDVLDGPEGDDARIRPNQIFAVSLSESPLDAERQRRVVQLVGHELLTPFGLRSLSPGDPDYRGRYEGGPAERDSRYHQGTVWSWLLGPFVEAHLRVHADKAAALRLLEPMAQHLSAAGLGSISEIFDGDAPHSPRGCFAQAWSVAELLRVFTDDAIHADARGSALPPRPGASIRE